jgi:hypothetical protein
VHDRLVGGPVTVRMEYLAAQVQNGESYTYPVSTKDQEIPGLGYCAAVGNLNFLLCRSTFKGGDYLTYATYATRGPCGSPPVAAPDPLNNEAPPGLVHVDGFIEHIGFISPLPLFSPIDVNQGYIGRWDNDQSYRVCLGYPGTFTRKHIQRLVRLETPVTTIVLKDSVQ